MKKSPTVQKIKNDAIYVAAKMVMAFGAAAPLRLGLPLGRGIGRAAFFVLRPDRKKVLRHLKIAFPNSSSQWRRETGAATFANLGQSFFELFHFDEIFKGEGYFKDYIQFDGEQNMIDMLKSGRGGLLVTGHIGNWELMAAFASSKGYPIRPVVRSLYDERIDKLLNDHRRKYHYAPITRGGDEGFREILKVLQDKEFLGLLMDQDTKVRGVFAPFMGRLAHTPTGPAYLAYALDLDVLACFVHREPNGRHILNISKPVPRPKTGDNRADIHEYTRILNEHISRQIANYPTEWVWMHRRWKKRPPDEPPHLNPNAKAAGDHFLHRSLTTLAGKFLKKLPRGAADKVGAGLGRLSYILSPERRQKADKNLRAALGAAYGEKDLERIRGASAVNRGKMAVDYLLADYLNDGDFTKMASLEGMDLLQSALSGGRGAVLLSAHFGSLDFGLWMIAESGVPVHLADRKIEHPYYRMWIRRLRQRHGLGTFYEPYDLDEIVGRLRANECVAFPVDRGVSRDAGAIVRFGNRRIVAESTVAKLLREHECPILTCRSERSGPGFHRVVIGPALKMPEAGESDFDRLVTQACVSAWEKIIMEKPEQWIWSHDRFSLHH